MNWYRTAQKAQKSKKPYNIYVLVHGDEKKIDGLKIEAYTAEQARYFVLKKNSRLQDYLEMGYEIVARLDKEEWERRARVQEMTERFKEEQIQNAWWQD